MLNAVSFNRQPSLRGDLLELRPVGADDFDALFSVAADPLIWEQHPERNRYQEATFRTFFEEALSCGGALVALDRATGQIIGSSRYYGYDAEQRVVEIGWTFLARAYWGGRYNGEMKQLMLEHAFRWVDRVIFVSGQTTAVPNGLWRRLVVCALFDQRSEPRRTARFRDHAGDVRPWAGAGAADPPP